MQRRDLIDLKDIRNSSLTPNPTKFNLTKLVDEIINRNRVQANLK